MKKKKNIKKKCLKYAIDKVEVEKLKELIDIIHNDPESVELGKQLILSSKVVLHNKRLINKYFDLDQIGYYSLKRLLKFISK